MRLFLLITAFLGGIVLHFYAMTINTILTNADSFAYFQMTHALKDFSSSGFGTGWFGFLYSVPLVFASFFGTNELFAGQIINLLLFITSGALLMLIGKRYLNFYYNLLLLILFFISPTLLHYNVNILSENLFLPLFLLLVLLCHLFIENEPPILALMIGGTIGLMYITRGEAFIYIIAIYIIFLSLMFKRVIDKRGFLKYFLFILCGFSVIALPYIYHLHTVTGEWTITNKGSSNIRQAMMRGIDNMSDEGFEKAVGELTSDKHHLKGGFAGGLKYDKPEDGPSLTDLIMKYPVDTGKRFLENQKKIFTQIIPQMIVGDSIKQFTNPESRFFHNFFLFCLICIPIVLFTYGLFMMTVAKGRVLIIILAPFFIIASVFFSIFFILERYFIIFIPFIFLMLVYAIQEVWKESYIFSNIKYVLLGGLLVLNYYFFGVHYQLNNNDTGKYLVKKIAGERIRDYKDVIRERNPRIMERFPIVTYYAGAEERWLTPYTSNLADIIEYAKYNRINFLIVDTLDFKTYRPQLSFLLNEKELYDGLSFVKAFEYVGEKVLIYKFNY